MEFYAVFYQEIRRIYIQNTDLKWLSIWQSFFCHGTRIDKMKKVLAKPARFRYDNANSYETTFPENKTVITIKFLNDLI